MEKLNTDTTLELLEESDVVKMMVFVALTAGASSGAECYAARAGTVMVNIPVGEWLQVPIRIKRRNSTQTWVALAGGPFRHAEADALAVEYLKAAGLTTLAETWYAMANRAAEEEAKEEDEDNITAPAAKGAA